LQKPIKLDIVASISKLLYKHHCVIIPEFGGFITGYSPAKIHPTQHTFSPPSKTIAFNKNLIKDDGLLANQIAENENISYEKALEGIKKFVSNTRNQLGSGKRLLLNKVGTLSLDVEKNIQFTPASNVNYLGDSFGLTILQSPPIRRKTIEEKVEEKFTNRPSIPLEKRKRKMPVKYLFLAFSVVCLLASGTVLYYNNFFHLQNFSSSDLNPINSNPGIEETILPDIEIKESKPEIEKRKISIQDVQNYVEGNEGKSSTIEEEELVTIDEQTKPNPEPITKEVKQKKFHIIGGAFAIKSNAKRLVKRLKKKGFNAKILDTTKGGLHRVSYDSFESRAEALSSLSDARSSDNIKAWLLVKNI